MKPCLWFFGLLFLSSCVPDLGFEVADSAPPTDLQVDAVVDRSICPSGWVVCAARESFVLTELLPTTEVNLAMAVSSSGRVLLTWQERNTEAASVEVVVRRLGAAEIRLTIAGSSGVFEGTGVAVRKGDGGRFHLLLSTRNRDATVVSYRTIDNSVSVADTVMNVAGVVKQMDIVVGPDNEPVAFVFDESARTWQVARLDAEDWSEAPITTELDFDMRQRPTGEVSAVLRDDGKILVAIHKQQGGFQTTPLLFVQKEGLDWSDQYTLSAVNNSNIGAAGHSLSLTHHNETSRALYVATVSGFPQLGLSEWENLAEIREEIVINELATENISDVTPLDSAVDSVGTLHVVMAVFEEGWALNYLNYDGEQWRSETVVKGLVNRPRVAIDVDENDAPYLLYSAERRLMYNRPTR